MSELNASVNVPRFGCGLFLMGQACRRQRHCGRPKHYQQQIFAHEPRRLIRRGFFVRDRMGGMNSWQLSLREILAIVFVIALIAIGFGLAIRG